MPALFHFQPLGAKEKPMYRSNNRNTCDTSDLERQLSAARDEAARLREDRDREIDEQQRKRDLDRRERMAQYEEHYRQATNWPEALQKQERLLAKEVHLEIDDDPDETHFFSTSRDACALARSMWVEEAAKVAPQLAELQRQIAAIQDEIRNSVADRLEAASTTVGARNVASAMREYNTPEDLSEWLNW